MRTRVLSEITGEVTQLAVQGAMRVLRGMDTPDVATAFVRKAALAIKDVEGVAARKVEVWISPDADGHVVGAVLRDVLGGEIDVDMHVDEALVGGVRLVSAGQEVEASAQHSLQTWWENIVQRS